MTQEKGFSVVEVLVAVVVLAILAGGVWVWNKQANKQTTVVSLVPSPTVPQIRLSPTPITTTGSIPDSTTVKLPQKLNCVSSDLPGYKVANKFFVDFNNDKQDELVQVYAQDIERGCGAELPMMVKVFSGTTACHEEFTYPATLTPITGSFDDKRYNTANAQLMKNFWGDGRDVILVSGALNFCGSGVRNQLLFFSYQSGKYLKVDGPVFRELDFYFLSSHPQGSAILVARGGWEEGEAHFDPHRYAFVLYQWNGQEYEEKEIATTHNKYATDGENFKTILQNIQAIFQNEPEKLQLEIEKL